jgi:hypothetical protein
MSKQEWTEPLGTKLAEAERRGEVKGLKRAERICSGVVYTCILGGGHAAGEAESLIRAARKRLEASKS